MQREVRVHRDILYSSNQFVQKGMEAQRGNPRLHEDKDSTTKNGIIRENEEGERSGKRWSDHHQNLMVPGYEKLTAYRK